MGVYKSIHESECLQQYISSSSATTFASPKLMIYGRPGWNQTAKQLETCSPLQPGTGHCNAVNLTLAPWQQGKGLFENSHIFLKALFYVPCISLYLTGNRPTTDTPSQGWPAPRGGCLGWQAAQKEKGYAIENVTLSSALTSVTVTVTVSP